MASRSCAIEGCSNVAAVRCLAVGGPYCGAHCSCEGHSHRLSRPGARRGEGSQLRRSLHGIRYEALWELRDCGTYLVYDEKMLCLAYNIESVTGAMKFVIAVFAARLAWDTLPTEHRACVAVAWTTLSEALGATRGGRMLESLRSSMNAADVADVGMRVARMWARALTPISSLSASSSAASSSRERTPPPLRSSSVAAAMAEVISACVLVAGTRHGF